MFLVCPLCLPSASASPFQSKSASVAKSGLTFRPTDPLNEEAFDAFYNLDYDRSIQDFQKIVDRHPDDPFATNHLITALIFTELNRMGALNTGEYSNDSFVSQEIGRAHV